MGEVACSNHVIARDTFGQFIAACDVAGENMMRDMANDGAELSRAFAPSGSKPDPRTRKLKDSISAKSTATSAHWEASARHALPQETGARPHPITGRVRFFWEREGRMWNPGDNEISHPGNPAHPYLRPAYEIVMGRWMNYARRYFPR